MGGFSLAGVPFGPFRDSGGSGNCGVGGFLGGDACSFPASVPRKLQNVNFFHNQKITGDLSALSGLKLLGSGFGCFHRYRKAESRFSRICRSLGSSIFH